MPYTYFNNGFSYFNGSSYYVTYYPEITSVTGGQAKVSNYELIK